MEYCARCVYPANARPTIIFDEEGVCSGCRYHESRFRVNWEERARMLIELLREYKSKARAAGNIYDCIIPVSGGKDSHFQAHLMKVVYGMNPLFVTYNHLYNSRLGIRNLINLVREFNCDLIRFTPSPVSARKISRHMLKKVGDLTWHYHAGIFTFPFQIAVKYNIPLIIWGEHGFAELTGMFTIDDMVEFTKWARQEHDMRGYEPENLINGESGITKQDVGPYVFPSDEEIERVGVRGIFLSNFIYWDAKSQAELVVKEYNFGTYGRKRDRTFNLFAKTDDHANDVHDYLKYLKFGYGRATDDASTEIRHGRMTREEGIELVRQYDPTRPQTLDLYLRWLEVTEDEFEAWIEPMRDRDIWQRDAKGKWIPNDSAVNHIKDAFVEEARVRQVSDRTLSTKNRHLYYVGDSNLPPGQVGTILEDPRKDQEEFIIL